MHLTRLGAGLSEIWGSIRGKVKDFVFSTASIRLRGPPSLVSSWYQGLFPRE
jgi:hypothetical protein